LEPAAQLIEIHIYTKGTMDPKQNQTKGEMRKVGMLSNGDGSSPCDCAGWEHAQAPAMDPFATYLKDAFKSNAIYLVKSAQTFPDDKYTSSSVLSARRAHLPH
jgi:hypothetical protein